MKRALTINWPAIVLAVAFLTFAGYQSAAMRHVLQLAPPVVATVDLHRVMTQTEERTRVQVEVEELIKDMTTQGEEHASKIRDIEEELELYAPGSDKYQELLEKLSLATLEYQGFSEWARRRIEAASASRLSRMYHDIKSVISDEAREKGYDIVFVNDSLGVIRGGDEAEVSMQITSRRMLYSAPRLDITADIINRINAAAQVRGGG